jgi:acetate kinase
MADILTVNAGSSSVKIGIFAPDSAAPLGLARTLVGRIDGIGTPYSHATVEDDTGKALFSQSWPEGSGPSDVIGALGLALRQLAVERPGWKPAAVGHRFAHGGREHAMPVALTRAVRETLRAAIPLAPLHLPANLAGVEAAEAAFSQARQVATFDTAFHTGRPFHRAAYALPRRFYDEGVRRYGMHGLSYESVVQRMRTDYPEILRGHVVLAHLGNGASLCAARNGRSIETTMGFTPTDGLIMGTRCGQIDPGVLFYLRRNRGMDVDDLEHLLNKQSGLRGVSGIGPDMRALLSSNTPAAQEAVAMYCYRLVYHIGAMAACLCGMDALVFTGGVGENAATIRGNVCRALAWMGVELDPEANSHNAREITRPSSRIRVLVLPTDEDRMIARHAADFLAAS